MCTIMDGSGTDLFFFAVGIFTYFRTYCMIYFLKMIRNHTVNFPAMMSYRIHQMIQHWFASAYL